MPAVSKDSALEQLANEVKRFEPDELLEVYDEAFPDHPRTEQQARGKATGLAEQLIEHLYSGLEIDALMELWGLILPKHRNIWYDEEEERLHYNEEAEAVSYE